MILDTERTHIIPATSPSNVEVALVDGRSAIKSQVSQDWDEGGTVMNLVWVELMTRKENNYSGRFVTLGDILCSLIHQPPRVLAIPSMLGNQLGRSLQRLVFCRASCSWRIRSIISKRLEISRNFTSAVEPRGYGYPYQPIFQKTVDIAHKRNSDLLHDPVFNKGTGFTMEERERLGLHGLLPPKIKTLEEQEEFALERYHSGPLIPTPAEGVTPDQVRRWQFLTNLKDRNEQLYYRIIVEHFKEMAPIIYTPTVGWACANYGASYQRPRGMYFTARDVGEMDHMCYNWHSDEVDAIVVTDGSRILGLGDLGIGGLNISIGKLDLYVGAAGFHPGRVLPCIIDVGTNNKRLLEDPNYLGLRQERLSGPKYVAIVDEFVQAVMQRWPRAILQFEDFSTNNALK
ncbi:hypothetical protein AAMO2058_000999700 [Amorphochlora amoebiformis]